MSRRKILECHDLRKVFGKKEVLKGVSLEADAGDILGFIGPNGAGKTTTIKLILGLQSITSGSVLINGHDIEKDFTGAIRCVGTIVENPDLYMYMSGYENLRLIANLYSGVTKERIDEVVRLVGLENRIHDKVSKYSLGMRQRLGIAQAILHRPKLLVLDEPTNGLDPEGIKAVKDLLVMLAESERMAVLISSHNLLELESFCTRVAIIKNGEIVETSSMEDAKRVDSESVFHFVVDDADKFLCLMADRFEKTVRESVRDNDVLEKFDGESNFDNEKFANEGVANSESALDSEKIVKIDDENVKVFVDRDGVPAIVECLVRAGVKVYGVYSEEVSLEDAFLKKTGGNVID